MKELEAFERLNKDYSDYALKQALDELYDVAGNIKNLNVEYNTIKQALIKAQEQEKVLSIIKEYQVDIWLLKQCDYENYIRIRKEARVSVGQIINENGVIFEDEIPQEEFELLKRWLND